MDQKCAVVYNPVAGKAYFKNHLLRIEKILKQRYQQIGFFPTSTTQRADQIVAQLEACDLVLTAGGDGTFQEAISGNLQRKTPLLLSHVPCGTTNDYCRNFHISRHIPTTVQQIIDGDKLAVDILMINQIPCVLGCIIGNLSEIPYISPQKWKNRLGSMAYFPSTIKAILAPVENIRLSYQIGHQTHQERYASSFLILNTPSIGGLRNLVPDISLCDQKFDVLLLSARNKKEQVLKALKFFLLTQKRQQTLICSRTNHMYVTFPSNQVACLDGEKVILPSEVNVTNQQICLQLPKHSIQKIIH